MRLATPSPLRTRPSCRRPLLILAAALLVCASGARSGDKPNDDLPPPLFGESHLAQRAAAGLAGSSLGDTGPLRQAVLLAVGQATGCWELELPRGEALIPYGAASVLLGSVPGSTAAFNASLMLYSGDEAGCWSLEDMTRFRPLDPGPLASVVDKRPLASLADRTRAAVEETYSFQDALLKVLRIQHDVFERVARSNVTVEEIEEVPAKYRGQVLRLYGQLQRIRQIDAPSALRRFGAPKLFEVWISIRSGEIRRAVRVLTPLSLPSNLAVNSEVAVTGYFFKTVPIGKTDSLPGQPEHTAPLIIGHVNSVLGQEERNAIAAATAFAAGCSPFAGPYCEAIALHAGVRAQSWIIEDPSRVPPLDPRYLDGVQDGKTLPFNFDQNVKAERETFAYFDAVIKANRTPLKLFEASLHGGVTFAHLHNEPQRYRGDVVRISGLLRRVRQFEPNLIEKQAGVKNVYEAWLVDDEYQSSPPACLICTELPAGIRVAEKVQGLMRVSFVGYFFKKYLFKAADAKNEKEFRVAPLIIGHLVPEKKSAPAEKSDWTKALVPFILLTLPGTFIVVFLMTWAFRRADRRVMGRVGAAAPPFISASEPEPPPPAPETLPPP